MLLRRLVVVIGVVLASALAAVPGSAQEDDARTLFQRGQQAYSQGDYEAAIQQWSRAYELDARPLLQYNLSQAYERLGRLGDAIAALERYLERADPADQFQADARARLATLRERFGRTSVTVVGGPEGATITIDGSDRGRTPRPDPILLEPGSHRVVVSAAGYQDFVSSVVVPAGQSVEVPVDMQPASAAPAASSDELPVVPIILFSVGGAAVIAGAVMGGVALSDAENAPSSDSPQADSARALALAADVTMGVGVAAAAAGLVVLLVGMSSESESQPVAVAPWGGPSGAGVSVHAQF